MVIQKFSRTMLFHDLIDHLGYLRRYICFTSSLLSMLSTNAAEARSRVPVRLHAPADAGARSPYIGAGRGWRVEMAGSDGLRCC